MKRAGFTTGLSLLWLASFSSAHAGGVKALVAREDFFIWIAIFIGLLTSFAVFQSANRIGGGALRRVYLYFGVGMLLVTVGLVSVAVPAWSSPYIVMRVHDLLFVAGFGVMAYGARQMLVAAGMER